MAGADDVITVATTELGKPYVYGDEGPTTFDCSGLVQYVLARVGIKAPRTAAQQQAWARPVETPRAGDLVFYGTPAHHVGIYLGGGKMINAPHAGALVRIDGVGQPTGYGRVPGLGAAVAPVVGVLTGAGSAVTGWAGDLIGAGLDRFRSIAVEGVFVVLGLGLLGLGAYRAVTTPGRNVARRLL